MNEWNKKRTMTNSIQITYTFYYIEILRLDRKQYNIMIQNEISGRKNEQKKQKMLHNNKKPKYEINNFAVVVVVVVVIVVIYGRNTIL